MSSPSGSSMAFRPQTRLLSTVIHHDAVVIGFARFGIQRILTRCFLALCPKVSTGLLTTRHAQRLLIALGACWIWAAVTRTSQASPASRQNDKQKASPLRVVGIQYTTGAGLCGCYCGGELHVNPG